MSRAGVVIPESKAYGVPQDGDNSGGSPFGRHLATGSDLGNRSPRRESDRARRQRGVRFRCCERDMLTSWADSGSQRQPLSSSPAARTGIGLAAPPEPIRVYHFTHLRNLAGIIERGLRSDAACRRDGLTEVEIGSAGIRERRLHLPVGDVGPGGCVGDYVPWYFGPRSPMMYTLSRNNYEYQAGFESRR